VQDSRLLSKFGHVAQVIKYIFFIVLGNHGRGTQRAMVCILKQPDGMIVDVRVKDMSFTERPTSHSRKGGIRQVEIHCGHIILGHCASQARI
jgi:hypothetical protein